MHDCQGSGAEWAVRAVKLLRVMLLWWVHATTPVSNLTECTPPGVNPTVNHTLRVMAVCPGGSQMHHMLGVMKVGWLCLCADRV